MKKYLFNIVLFFLTIVIIDFCLGKAFDYMSIYAKGGEGKRMRDICVEDCHDVLIMGSSRAHHHYVTSLLSDSLGLDCYNAGYDGNGILLAYGMFKLLTEHYKPRMIIYDVEPVFDINVYPGDNNNTRYLSLQKPFFKNPSVAQIFKDVDENEFYKVHSGMCRHNSTCITTLIDYLTVRSVDGDCGYIPLHGRMLKEPEREQGAGTAKSDMIKLRYLQRFIHETKSNDIKLIMVASPKYGSTKSSSFDIVKSYCKKANVPFLDYYTDSYFMSHKELFKESMHLNDDGARVFTNMMVKHIKEQL